jgi:DNA modification methylase
MEFFDGTDGWAAGARDVLVTTGHSPYMITYNAPSPDPAYANMRAYMWMKGAEWVKNGGRLPHVPELIGELTIPQYTYLNGKFQIEPKEFIKERLGRSPNYADALFNTFAIPDQPAENSPVGLMVRQQQHRAELQDLLGLATGAIDEDTVIEPARVPVSRRGDLWILGSHRLRCGDSTDPADVAHLMAEHRPILMVTDPPYGVDYRPDWRNAAFGEANRSTGIVQNDNRADWREAWKWFAGPVAYVWHAGTKSVTVAASLEACGFEIRSQIIWAKPHFVISRGHYHVQHEPCWYAVRHAQSAHWQADRCQSTLWSIGNGLAQSGSRLPENELTGHGTQKPVECMRRPVLHHTESGDTIYDPFLGSGTTIIAAEQTRRRCLGMELDPIYVDLVVHRWQAFTGKTAILDGDGRDFEALTQERLG